MKTFFTVIFSAAVISAISGCATQKPIPMPDQAMVEKSGVEMETLKRGHTIYLTECSRCHEPVMPTDVSGKDWHLVVPGMAWNAGISEEDEEAVTRYIMAAR
jgi:cytochrome c5